jgi:hypothetical protein
MAPQQEQLGLGELAPRPNAIESRAGSQMLADWLDLDGFRPAVDFVRVEPASSVVPGQYSTQARAAAGRNSVPPSVSRKSEQGVAVLVGRKLVLHREVAPQQLLFFAADQTHEVKAEPDDARLWQLFCRGMAGKIDPNSGQQFGGRLCLLQHRGPGSGTKYADLSLDHR